MIIVVYKFKFFKYLDEKGMFDFDFVIGIILILSLIVIIPDSFTFTAKMNAITRANRYVLSAVQRQGFVSYYNYDSANLPSSEYSSNGQIFKNVKTMLSNAGYDPDTVIITINDQVISNYTIRKYNYGSELKVKVTASYPLKSSNIVFPKKNITSSNTLTGVCTRHVRS